MREETYKDVKYYNEVLDRVIAEMQREKALKREEKIDSILYGI